MKLKIIGNQIYDDHEEKIENEYDNANIIMGEKIIIEYLDGEIIYNKNENIIELKNKNAIIVSLNEEKELNYNTPYGIINLKTRGEKILLEENPFKLIIEYKLVLNENVEYKNILEVIII